MNNYQTQQINNINSIIGFTASVIFMGLMVGMFIPRSKGDITEEIIERSGIRPYKPPSFVVVEEHKRKRRPPMATRTREIGPYVIKTERRDDRYAIKLYENLPGWRRKLVATLSGLDLAECDMLFEKLVDTIIQVRFEHKTALMR